MSEDWLCRAGHRHEDGLHCATTGEEPPWGCPCAMCQNGDDEDLDEPDFPHLRGVVHIDLDDDDTPCAYCGETACEASCTGAILAREAAREEDDPHATP